MVRHARSAKSPVVKAAVAVLLAVAIIGALWVPVYAHAEPKLGAFPFFYWYQLILVPVTAILCWISYLLVRTKPARPRRRAPQAAARDRDGAWR
jgi:protein-S-isoprenylcysteine O-methyltransferase Ste14